MNGNTEQTTTSLPGYWELLWLLFMQPVTLHHRLKACGIDEPNAPAWLLWRKGGQHRSYTLRMLTVLITATPVLACGLNLVLQLFDFDTAWQELVVLVGYSVAFGVAVGVTLGVAKGVALAVALGMASAPASAPALDVPLATALGVAKGVPSAVALDVPEGIALGVFFGVFLDVAFCIADGMPLDKESATPLGVVLSLAFGVFVGLVHSLTPGLAIGVGTFLGLYITLHYLPLFLLESLAEPLLYLLQRRTGWNSLRYSPALRHELIYFPLPFLNHHILLTAESDPALAHRTLDACAIAPGLKRTGRIALASLQARELEALARAGQFGAALELQGTWLPGLEGADPLLTGYADLARYLQAAQHASLAYHQLNHLENGRKAFKALENRLLSERSELAQALRPVLPVWRSALEKLGSGAERRSRQEIPNPFRFGNALSPEEGAELFRGRDSLVRQVEELLGDAGNAASLALLGPRRCGKTTLLKMLPAMLPDAVVVLFDLQDNPVDSLPGLFEAMDRQARRQARRDRQLELPELDRKRLAESPFEAAKSWLDALEEALGDRRLLFCIDEFERLEELFPGNRQELLKFMGLLRATIQHKRRVRLLVSGAAPFEEWGELWSDHFINASQLRIGHLEHEVTLKLLTEPIPAFPPEAIDVTVAEEVYQRCHGQPYLVQLYGHLLVSRLNATKRRAANLDDVDAVEPQVLVHGGYYFRNTYIKAPEKARAVLDALATGQHPQPDQPTRRWLERRLLIDTQGHLNIPVLSRWIQEELT